MVLQVQSVSREIILLLILIIVKQYKDDTILEMILLLIRTIRKLYKIDIHVFTINILGSFIIFRTEGDTAVVNII